jgi:hypothetical protein
VRLGDITTSDQLILALAELGYRKVESEPKPGCYRYSNTWQPCRLESGGRAVVHHHEVEICPTGQGHGSDAGIGALLDDSNRIRRWLLIESYAGTTRDLPPSTRLDELGAAIEQWMPSEEVGHG